MTAIGTWSKALLGGQEYLVLFTVSEEPGEQLTFTAQIYRELPEIEAAKYKIERGRLRGPAFSDAVASMGRALHGRKLAVTGRSFTSFDGALADAAAQLENPA